MLSSSQICEYLEKEEFHEDMIYSMANTIDYLGHLNLFGGTENQELTKSTSRVFNGLGS